MSTPPSTPPAEELSFSIVTIVYNNAETIRMAVESVLEQTHPRIQHVVIDGGSTDGTLEILEEYRDRLGVLVSGPDEGLYDALNKGIARSTEDIIGFVHADDLLAGPDALAAVAEGFSSSGSNAVYGDVERFKNDDPNSIFRFWKGGEYNPRMLKRGWMPPHTGFFAYRRVYEAIGDFNCSFRIAADYDWLLRFMTSDLSSMTYLPKVIVKMREGGVSNSSLRNILDKSKEDYRALRANRVGGIRTLLWKNVRKVPQFFNRS